MNGKAVATVVVLIVVIAGALAYATAGREGGVHDASENTVTDSVGRTVQVPESLDDGIVVLGSSTSPLRLLSMFDVYDCIVEVDQNEINNPLNGRGYAFAYDYTVKDAHASNVLEGSMVESIGDRSPSLIVVTDSLYASYRDGVETLAKHFPTLVLRVEGDLWNDDCTGVSDFMTDTLTMLGKVLGREDRAEELVRGIDSTIRDIRSLVGETDIRAFLAGTNYGGTNDLNTTLSGYLPFEIVGIDSAYEGHEGSKVEIPVDRLSDLEFDMMFIDPSTVDRYSTEISQDVMEYVWRLNSDSDGGNDVRIRCAFPVSGFGTNYDASL